jgi:hypothetical protein
MLKTRAKKSEAMKLLEPLAGGPLTLGSAIEAVLSNNEDLHDCTPRPLDASHVAMELNQSQQDQPPDASAERQPDLENARLHLPLAAAAGM